MYSLVGGMSQQCACMMTVGCTVVEGMRAVQCACMMTVGCTVVGGMRAVCLYDDCRVYSSGGYESSVLV